MCSYPTIYRIVFRLASAFGKARSQPGPVKNIYVHPAVIKSISNSCRCGVFRFMVEVNEVVGNECKFVVAEQILAGSDRLTRSGHPRKIAIQRLNGPVCKSC